MGKVINFRTTQSKMVILRRPIENTVQEMKLTIHREEELKSQDLL